MFVADFAEYFKPVKKSDFSGGMEEKAWQIVLCVEKKELSGIMSATQTTKQKD
jgi:hypothetical protein